MYSQPDLGLILARPSFCLLHSFKIFTTMEAILKTLESATIAVRNGQISEEWRVRLLTAASGLITALQKPEETLMRETFWVGHRKPEC